MIAETKLTPAERDTSAWQKVAHHIDERIKMFRAKTENPELPEAERLGAAWRIRELKEFAKLAEPAKQNDPQPFPE